MWDFVEHWAKRCVEVVNRWDPTWRYRRVLSRTLLALVLSAFTLQLDLFRIEAFFYDARMRLKGTEAPHPAIRLVIINEQDKDTMEQMRLSPMRAHLFALKRLIREKPAAIAYLNRFSPSEVQGEWDASEEFVDVVRAAEAEGVRIFFGTDVDLAGEILPPYPLSLLPHFPAMLHKDGKMFSEDKVSRRALLTVPDDPSLHLRLAYLDLNQKDLKSRVPEVRGAYFYIPGRAWQTLIRYPGNTITKPDLFPSVAFTNLLNDDGNTLGLEGKTILVGNIPKEELGDVIYSPYSRVDANQPKIFTHAAILDTLLKDSGIRAVPLLYDALLTFTLCLLLIFFSLRFTPTQGVLCLLSTGALLFGGALLAFKFWGLWVNLVHPFFALFCTYYLVVPYRAILEYKKRWKVQEQHDLLVQVEEMKGNFLSLMSHDLKTPVARIQGLAELVLKQGNLSDEQIEEMKQILESTDSLNRFITKILELTRVESSEIKLNTQSRDINKVIEKCLEKLKFQAKQKDIQLKSHLEPLFPIQLDASLIIQVLTNLIDNAIQYSPPGSTIEVFSRESGDRVMVGIRDQGRGLDAKERKMLFTKFYRGENPAGDQVRGSGLGLYLSKYFIELHKGAISVESEKGVGSTFTISLPIQMEG